MSRRIFNTDVFLAFGLAVVVLGGWWLKSLPAANDAATTSEAAATSRYQSREVKPAPEMHQSHDVRHQNFQTDDEHDCRWIETTYHIRLPVVDYGNPTRFRGACRRYSNQQCRQRSGRWNE